MKMDGTDKLIIGIGIVICLFMLLGAIDAQTDCLKSHIEKVSMRGVMMNHFVCDEHGKVTP